MEDKKREELTLPSYMQRKSARKTLTPPDTMAQARSGKSSGHRNSTRERAQQPVVSKGASARHKQNVTPINAKTPPQSQRKAQASQPAAGAKKQPSKPVHTQGNAKRASQTVRRAGQKAAAPSNPQNHAPKAPREENLRVYKPSGKQAQAKPAREQARQEAGRRDRGIRLGRICLLGILLAGLIFCGVYFLGQDSSPASIAADGTIGETARIPAGVSILGIDVGGMTRSEARAAVTGEAEAIRAGAQITLTLDQESYTITGEEILFSYDMDSVLQQALDYVEPEESAQPQVDVVDVTEVSTEDAPGTFNRIFTYDASALRRALENIAAEFDIAAVNAQGQPTMHEDHTVSFEYEEGTAGRALDVEATMEKIQAALLGGQYTAQVEGVYNTVNPQVTAATLAKGIALRGSFTTRYATIGQTSEETPTIENRVYNIQKAADIINGCVVEPGESWSFNDFVGERSEANGWKQANGIANGREYVLQYGGGICQVSTTLYNALLQADVTVTNRRAHSIPSDYVDHGLDATVDYAMDLDLEFVNDTGAPLYLFAYYEDVEGRHRQDITFLIYGAPLEEGVTYQVRSETVEEISRNGVNYTDDDTIPRGYKVVTIKARSGYVAEVYLDKYVNGELAESEYLYTDRYEGNDEYALRGTASPKYYEPPENAVPIDD